MDILSSPTNNTSTTLARSLTYLHNAVSQARETGQLRPLTLSRDPLHLVENQVGALEARLHGPCTTEDGGTTGGPMRPCGEVGNAIAEALKSCRRTQSNGTHVYARVYRACVISLRKNKVMPPCLPRKRTLFSLLHLVPSYYVSRKYLSRRHRLHLNVQ